MRLVVLAIARLNLTGLIVAAETLQLRVPQLDAEPLGGLRTARGPR